MDQSEVDFLLRSHLDHGSCFRSTSWDTLKMELEISRSLEFGFSEVLFLKINLRRCERFFCLSSVSTKNRMKAGVRKR